MKLVGFVSAFFVVAFIFGVISASSVLANAPFVPTFEVVPAPTDGGIRLEVPRKFHERFERWKSELLSTEFGRNQWESWATNKNFVLTIQVDAGKKKGAGTGRFQWDDNGNLVGATITLGSEIDEGYPDPIYYPVLNSLSTADTEFAISGRLLAATKLSHELGHVSQTAAANASTLERQSKLIPQYTSIFLRNGHNPYDQKLVQLAEEIGGTPMEIWESREYWSEVTAMEFLGERIKNEPFFCHVFSRIRNNVQMYAREYVSRFEPAAAVPCK